NSPARRSNFQANQQTRPVRVLPNGIAHTSPRTHDIVSRVPPAGARSARRGGCHIVPQTTTRKEPTMFWQRLWQRWMARSTTSSRTRLAPRLRARLMVEPLEDRVVPANFTAATVPDLIGAMTTANQTADADTITLTPGKTFTLNAAIRIGFENNSYYSYTGLPVIAPAGGSLTIVGNGDVIERSAAKGTPAFHLFMVDTGASLTLENLTLQGGLSYSSARWDVDSGGAINNRGALTLRSVTVQNNVV